MQLNIRKFIIAQANDGWKTTTFGLLLVAFYLSACTVTPYVGEPLTQHPPDDFRQITQMADGDRSPELLVLMAFSGGGTRAAALAYGVLLELSLTQVKTSRGTVRLLDEIDVISSVSGGSFTNAYFGLYGDRIFEDYEERFLRKDVDNQLVGGLFSPENWKTLGSQNYGLSDLAADYYDAQIFDGKTFSDLQRPGAPLVIITSTDIGTGDRFSFTPVHFNLLCNDLREYPIARAVAASSAVPGILTPITIQNYAGQCGYTLPQWLQTLRDETATTVRRTKVENLEMYLDSEARPWLHLVDGGISDNVGLRAYHTIFDIEDNPERVFSVFGHDNVREILMITVNADVEQKLEWARRREPPSAVQVLTQSVTVQMDRLTANTIQIVRDSYTKRAETMSTEDYPVHFEFVEVNFDSVPNPNEREFLNEMPTTFDLDDTQIDKLISTGRSVLRDAPGFRRFITRNQPTYR